MKKENVYDKTKIILISDHGWWGRTSPEFKKNFSNKVPGGYENRFTESMVQPLLMVKDFNQKGDVEA